MEENLAKQLKLKEELEKERKKKKYIDPNLHWTCKLCGVKDNLNTSIKCKICGRAKPGEEANVDALQTDSGSFSTRITTEETNVDALQTDSASFSTRTTTLETASGSFSTRTTTLEALH